MANKLTKLRERLESISDYWNGSRDDVAMYDALLHLEDSIDNIIDDVDELSTMSLLDYDWKYCDEYGLPECTHEMGGSGFSENVFVTNGKRCWVDSVIFPHGIYGGDTTPKFCSTSQDKEIIAWMNIPTLQKKRD